MCLRYTKEGDTFCALDSDLAIDGPTGEAVYASASTVVTRHINWKQSREGLIEESSQDICFMSEVLSGYPNGHLHEMIEDFKKQCSRIFEKEPQIYFVNKDQPLITF